MGIYSHPTQTSRYDLYKCGIATPTHGTAAVQHYYENSRHCHSSENNTGHLTKNAITFTLNSVFSDLGLFEKLVLRDI